MAVPVYNQGEGFAAYTTGGETSVAVAVPTGSTVSAIDIVRIVQEITAGTPTHPAASGWQEAPNGYAIVAGSHAQTILWKPTNPADTGTHTFTWTTGCHRTATSCRISGVSTSDSWSVAPTTPRPH